MRHPAALFACLLALLPAGPGVAHATLAHLTNGRVAVRFDLATGAYDLLDARTGRVLLAGAHAELEDLSTRDEGLTRAAARSAVRDELGAGESLTITCRGAGRPDLLIEFRVYPGRPFIVLRTGLRNSTRTVWQVKRMAPVSGGTPFPGATWQDLRTLNAPSGGNQTVVTRGPTCASPNDLLLTLRQGGRRQSLVLGGLKTLEYPKYAAFAPDGDAAVSRRAGLSADAPGRLVAYLQCGSAGASGGAPGGARLTVEQGQPFTWPGAEAHPLQGSVAFHEREVIVRAHGLDPAKRYVLGFSWWDFDGNGRVEAVRAIAASGARAELVSPTPLPAYRSNRQGPVQRAVVLPAAAYARGTLQLAFTNEAPVPNAVVSEVWLWEQAGVPLDPSWERGKPVGGGRTGMPARAHLEARDPVGKRVDPGIAYLPGDSFYVDCLTPDPFEALELYGRQLRLANHAHPNPYAFPTICAWYAGVWNTPGAQNHPDKSKYRIATTAGLVEEMDCVRRSGFLRYSSVAGRIVPDNYTENNPQGWWDDAHWQREGFYVAPYETSRKWGRAMQERGGLAITYFQPAGPRHSRDFRETHRDLLIGGSVEQWLDYTKPATRAYMRGVYAAMRGAISGMMFDYCDEMWVNVASHGGFADPYTTAAGFYRTFLTLAREGLGPNSWIHERSIGSPPADLALGIVDSQRTSGDTNRVDPAMVARSGLRWYKNRVVLAYDMDSKELNEAWKVPGYTGTEADGRRMLLTVAYVTASRLLLANSFRDLKPEVLHDLSRTFPYHAAPRSARPVDAFATDGWPRVYDFPVTPAWHQVTLLNNALPTRDATISVALSRDSQGWGLGLDARREYYVYDFWNDRFVGRMKGNGTLSQRLRAGEARMLSVHAVEPVPQFLATDRHLMQGYVDMVRAPRWDSRTHRLAGASGVVGGETYRVVLALNGWRPARATGGRVRLLPGGRLAELLIDLPRDQTVSWSVRFTPPR